MEFHFDEVRTHKNRQNHCMLEKKSCSSVAAVTDADQRQTNVDEKPANAYKALEDDVSS